MLNVRPKIWFVMLCLCVGVLIFVRHREDRGSSVARGQARPARHETFGRVPPTAPSPASVATLVAELNDSSPNVRERAAVELGNAGMGALEVAPELKRLAANDPDEEVRRAARTALYNVRGGEPLPRDFSSPTPVP